MKCYEMFLYFTVSDAEDQPVQRSCSAIIHGVGLSELTECESVNVGVI